MHLSTKFLNEWSSLLDVPIYRQPTHGAASSCPNAQDLVLFLLSHDEAAAQAFVTLATNDTYALGALVLASSLQRVGTTKAKVVLITPEVSLEMRSLLAAKFDLVEQVDVIDSKDEAILKAMKRPELGVTLTKIHCWSLTQFTKCVFLDADTLVVQNVDELFEKEELSAVPDIGWPDCFNSGVFVYVPSEDTFKQLVQLAATDGSFDGGDQGLLNQFFSNWNTSDISRHLSFVYNMTLVSTYSYTPAFKRFGANVKIVHFLGSLKPWLFGYDPKSKTVQQPSSSSSSQQLEHVQKWWSVFVSDVQPSLKADMHGLASALAKLDLSTEAPVYGGNVVTEQPDAMSRRLAWESGEIDYLGGDSFDNIQKKLDAAMGLSS
ncbi:Glycogenin-1 [Halotydeus destructor]|nr:Glycogenin-1 [Halotydeus destructor]